MERQLSLLRVKQFLSESSLQISDNSNIGHSFLGMYRLDLNEDGFGKLALILLKE